MFNLFYPHVHLQKVKSLTCHSFWFSNNITLT